MQVKKIVKWIGAAGVVAGVVVVIVAVGTVLAQGRGRTGTFDTRDGKTYRTVRMPDGKMWMAENLNHQTYSSWCYDDDPVNCEKYGRLYTWEAAMKACPEGWRLPTDAEWTALTEAVGGQKTAGTKLKSKTVWTGDKGYIPGTDDYGFSALPGAYRWGGSFNNVGYYGSWWAATEGDATYARYRSMGYYYENVGSYWGYKEDGFSARCLRD